MPEVYRARCKQCRCSPDVGVGGVAGYVATDGCDGGVVLPSGYLGFRRDDGEMVCLPHPIEDLTLQENGGDWNSASRNGRLLSVTYNICVKCGTINEEIRIHDDRQGCMVGLLAAIVVFIVGKFVFGIHVGLAFALAYAALLVPLVIASILYRVRWSSVNADTKLTECIACGGRDFCTLPQATKDDMMCPNCRTKNMVYSDAGFS